MTQTIGQIIRRERLDKGFPSRASLVNTRPLKDKITQEGLRKIEEDERVPRIDNLKAICQALGLSDKKTKELKRMAVEKNVQRIAHQAKVPVTIKVDGKPLRVMNLPAQKESEKFVRDIVTELTELVGKFGVMDQDVDYFRQYARDVLLKKLSA